MDKAARLKLKQFINDNIPFRELKQAGFFAKDIRKTDYEKIAERVCQFFNIKQIYDYGKITCSGIICYAKPGDISGLATGHAEIIRPNVDVSCPLNWSVLKAPEQIDLLSKDQYLN